MLRVLLLLNNMSYVKEKTAVKIDTKQMAKFLTLAGLAIFLPFYLHIQLLTGPIVNAILILTLFLVGMREAMIVALVPSIVALGRGLLPPVLAPMVPFIMISNVLFIITIDYFYNNIKNNEKGYWVGILSGSLLKFLFLLVNTNLIVTLVLNKNLAAKIAQITGVAQFATAIAGGFIAWFILKWLRRI